MNQPQWSHEPWRVFKAEQDGRAVAGLIGYIDQEDKLPVVVADVNRYLPEAKANAQLMATAQRLYEALRMFTEKGTIKKYYAFEVERALKVMAEARGEE